MFECIADQVGRDLRDALLVAAGEPAEVALAREAPQFARRALHAGRRFEPRQRRMRLVDRLELERLLVSGVVQVVLLVERGDEAIGLVPEGIDGAARRDFESPGAVVTELIVKGGFDVGWASPPVSHAVVVNLDCERQPRLQIAKKGIEAKCRK